MIHAGNVHIIRKILQNGFAPDETLEVIQFLSEKMPESYTLTLLELYGLTLTTQNTFEQEEAKDHLHLEMVASYGMEPIYE